MEFKTGDKVKIISLDNTFAFHFNKELLNKILTVNSTITVFDSHFVRFKEEDVTFMNTKDLILVNNYLEIE